MFTALTLVTFREWKQHKLRLALTILGISLGVAVFLSVRTANKTLVNSLHVTIEKLAGKSTLQIIGGESGFSEEILKRVRATPGVQYAEPVTETFATITLAGDEKVLILGLDLSSELKLYEDSFDPGKLSINNPLAFSSRGDSIAVTRSFAERFSLKEGDKLTVNVQSGPKEMTIRGLFSASGVGEVFDGNVAVMDLPAAQDAFGRDHRIDRIDVSNTPDISVETMQNRLSEWLPSGIKAVRPELRGQNLENAVSSIHYGLTIMSFIALLIGVFIIFNSFSISLNQRWKEIGVLRALGVERGNIQRMFLFEAALMGLIGSLFGIGFGFGLAELSMRFVGNVTASFFGFASSPQALEFNPVYAVQAVIAGILASVVAAWLPARSASDLDPALALHNIESRQREPVTSWYRLGLGLIFVIGGLLFTRFGPAAIGLNIPLFYGFITLLGMIFLIPEFIRVGAWVIRPLMNRLFGVEGLIAVQTMARSHRRTNATVIALMTGLAFVFGQGSFITSQKTALDRALFRAVDADLLVAASNEVHSRTYHFTEATANELASLPEVAVADAIRIASVEYDGLDVSILSHDMNAFFRVSPDLLDIGDYETARASTARGDGMLVSSNFAARWNVKLGDVITLDTPGGPLNLTVVGMLDYYRSEKGSIFFDRSLYKDYWRDSDVDYLFIDLKEGVDRSLVKAKIGEMLRGKQTAFIYTHDEYRQWVSAILDQFFALMYVQMVVAVCVAVIGLVNTMVISVAERRRELGIFRAIGGLRGQVAKMVILEAVAISLIGVFVGTVAGLLNAYFLVNTVTRVIGGFTLPMIFPVSMVLIAIPMVITLAVVAAWLPARSASRQDVVKAIGYE
jgi:putative ABC transport system permease protein